MYPLCKVWSISLGLAGNNKYWWYRHPQTGFTRSVAKMETRPQWEYCKGLSQLLAGYPDDLLPHFALQYIQIDHNIKRKCQNVLIASNTRISVHFDGGTWPGFSFGLLMLISKWIVHVGPGYLRRTHPLIKIPKLHLISFWVFIWRKKGFTIFCHRLYKYVYVQHVVAIMTWRVRENRTNGTRISKD